MKNAFIVTGNDEGSRYIEGIVQNQKQQIFGDMANLFHYIERSKLDIQ